MASIPLVGAFLEQLLFGTLDDGEAREKHADVLSALDSIARAQTQNEHVVEQILEALKQQAALPKNLTAQVDAALDGIREQPPAEPDDEPVPTVFISSTICDLEHYREAARDAALRARFLPILSEDFPAAGYARAFEICKARVSQVDALAVLVGHRYGWVPPEEVNGQRRSITWLECHTALENGVEILPFLVSPDYKGLDEWDERLRLTRAIGATGVDIAKLAQEVDGNVRKLAEFRGWLSSDQQKLYRKTFTSPDNLQYELLDSLNHWRKRQPRFALTGRLSEAEGDPTRYLEWMRDDTRFVNIQGLSVRGGAPKQCPIVEVYIPLLTTKPASGEEDETPWTLARDEMQRLEAKPIALQQTLQESRAVIVGDPGSGKTTFLRRTAHALSLTLLGADPSAAREWLGLDEKAAFPMLISVGDLVKHIANRRQQKDGSAHPATADSPDWIADRLATLSDECQWALPKAYFQRKLADGEAIVLLDGLDEAPNATVRGRMSRLLQNAVAAFGKCRFVVTTRPHTYDHKVKLTSFAEFTIADLDDETIERSIMRWSSVLFDERERPAREHADHLIAALRARPEIRRMCRTPVMLTALTVVHWNKRSLPEQRADLYESILGWLAETKAHEEGLGAEQRLELLQELAFEMQSLSRGRQEAVEISWAGKKLDAFFSGANQKQRRAAATEFLEDEMNRSGIVLKRRSEVRFWHASFREYLTARRFAGEVEEEQEKLLFDGARLYQPEWREVALLYAGVLRMQGLKKADAFVRLMLGRVKDEPLPDKARCVALVEGIVRDLRPLQYQPETALYGEVLDAVMGVFDAEKSQRVPFDDRLAVAEALARASDPRFLDPEANWVRIDACEFTMGSEESHNAKPHPVWLDAFEIGRFPVTVGEFMRFAHSADYLDKLWWRLGWNPETRRQDTPADSDHSTRPIARVNWFEANAYCEWLIAKTGRIVRLPTEAEWERTASGGEGRKYPWGSGAPDESLVNYEGVSHATPVGLYPLGASNEGVMDLAGNVFEWCRDWYSDYGDGIQENPTGPPTGEYRVFRGGSWIYINPADLRCSNRVRDVPDGRSDNLGFRCVREVSS